MASSKVTRNKIFMAKYKTWFLLASRKSFSTPHWAGFISVAEALTEELLLEFLFHCRFDRWANFARYEMSDDCASSIRFKVRKKSQEKNTPHKSSSKSWFISIFEPLVGEFLPLLLGAKFFFQKLQRESCNEFVFRCQKYGERERRIKY